MSKWVKGQSGNPGGRVQDDFTKLFRACLLADSKKHKVSLIEHAIKEARSDNTLLGKILAKILPDLKSVDVKTTQGSPFRLILDCTPKLPTTNQAQATIQAPATTSLPAPSVGVGLPVIDIAAQASTTVQSDKRVTRTKRRKRKVSRKKNA